MLSILLWRGLKAHPPDSKWCLGQATYTAREELCLLLYNVRRLFLPSPIHTHHILRKNYPYFVIKHTTPLTPTPSNGPSSHQYQADLLPSTPPLQSSNLTSPHHPSDTHHEDRYIAHTKNPADNHFYKKKRSVHRLSARACNPT